MGLFDKKKCDICGKEKTRNKLKKFAICQSCGNSWKIK